MSRRTTLSIEHGMGIASAAASFFIVFSFALFPDLRKLRYMQLVFYVAVNDMIASIAIALGHASSGSAECWFQGMSVTLNYLSSIFWTVVISYQVWLVLDRKKVLQNMTMTHIICWGLPVLLTLLPLSTNTYGESPAFFQSKWCFVADRHDSPHWGVSMWTFTSFFLWIFISLILTTFFLTRVYMIVKQMVDIPEVANYTLRKLILYPLITIMCWLPCCVIYLVFLLDRSTVRGERQTWKITNTFAVSTAVAQGLFNSIVFMANNELVRSKWLSLWKGDFSVLREQYIDEEHVERPDSIFSYPDFLSDRDEVMSIQNGFIQRETELSSAESQSCNDSSTMRNSRVVSGADSVKSPFPHGVDV